MQRRILVVEDDPTMRDVLTKVLRRAGYSVEQGCNGGEAMKLLTDGAFDLLLSDIRMSPIDGLLLTATAKSIHPRLKVLLVTAYGERADARDARAAGADQYMSKPFRMAQLLATVRELIGDMEAISETPH